MNDNLTATGTLTINLYDAQGNLKDQRELKNLVVTVGREYIASRMVGTASTVMGYMAIGTGTAAAAAANTTLGTESARTNNAWTATANSTSGTVAYAATFGPSVPAADAAITEAGIFNAASNGTMLCRTTFSAINKSTADTLTINWNVTINAS